jgi:hypothetical protein
MLLRRVVYKGAKLGNTVGGRLRPFQECRQTEHRLVRA